MTVSTTVEVDRRRLEKIRRLEAENKALRGHRERLERIVGLLAVIATKNRACEPLDLVAVLEELTA